MKKKLTTISAQIEAKQAKALKRLAKKEQRSVSAVIRQLIEKKLEESK